MNSYGYQSTEYVGSGEMPYTSGEGLPFGTSGTSALEGSASGTEGRNSPQSSEPPSTEREYKYNTGAEDERRSPPCAHVPLPSRSPPQ